MIYNDEQWKIIKNASPHFLTARKDYIRNVPRPLTDQIINTYEEATGKTLANKNSNCMVCVLRIYQTIGKTYFSDLDERNKLEEKKNEQISEQKNEQINDEIKPKRGRKKTKN